MSLRSLFGKSAEKLWQQGGDAMQENRDSEALALFESAISKEPLNPKYLTEAGRASIKLKQWGKARAFFERARAIAPDDPWPLFGLGNCCSGAKQFEAAIHIYDQVLAMDPLSDVAWFCKATSYADLGLFVDALLALDQCSKLNPAFSMTEPMRARIIAAMR